MKNILNFKNLASLLLNILAIIGMSGILTSCSVVYEDLEPCPDPKVKVPVKLYYFTDFYVWNHSYDPLIGKIKEVDPSLNLFPGYPGTSSKYSNNLSQGVVDIHVKVYHSSDIHKVVAEEVFSSRIDPAGYDTEFELELDPDESYTIAVWSQFRDSDQSGYFYDPSDFHSIGLISDNYRGNTDFRDGFSATAIIETTGKNPQEPVVMNMTRPMGKFELITVDLSEFLERETWRRGLATRASADEYHVQISFPMYYPNSYSAIDDRLENSVSGVSFMTRMTVTGTSEASLGYEYVLINDIPDAGVQMRVDIFDPSYTHVAGSTMLTVPLRRDCHTILKGTFLLVEGDGGIGIDPGFNGDHNITI